MRTGQEDLIRVLAFKPIQVVNRTCFAGFCVVYCAVFQNGIGQIVKTFRFGGESGLTAVNTVKRIQFLHGIVFGKLIPNSHGVAKGLHHIGKLLLPPMGVSLVIILYGKRIKNIYKVIYQSGLNVSDACKKVEEEFEESVEKRTILDFIARSKRGIIRYNPKAIADE